MEFLNKHRIEELLQLQEDIGEEFLEELVEGFEELAPQQLVDMRQAIIANNAEKVDFCAHSLKGSAGNLGMDKMATLCENMRSIYKQDDISRGIALCDQIDALYEQSMDELDEALFS
ncbi:MAG: Hpt domain-containing protein [Mariprofundales bacterium]